MTTLKPEHLPNLVKAFKSAVEKGEINLPAARDFCDECFNAVLDFTVASGKGAITTPVRFGGKPMPSEGPMPNPVEVTLSPKAQEAKTRAAAKRKAS